jgi:ABC-type uncharacterized transport system auxiliary subunit
MGLDSVSRRRTFGLPSGAVWGAVLLLVTACAQEPVPQDTFYRLSNPVADGAGAAVLNGVVEVERFTADGLNGGRPIVYSRADAPLQLKEYHYHFWVEPPAVMLQDRIVTFARAAGLAKTVVTPETRVEPDFILNGRILRFEQILGARTEIIINLEISIRAIASDRIHLLKTYEKRLPAVDASVPSAVRALDAAFAEILNTLATDLRGL